MAIYMTFSDPADSPTGQPGVRIRYTMHSRGGRTVPVLLYAHGTRELTPAAWAGFRAAGATLSADSEREKKILGEVLTLSG